MSTRRHDILQVLALLVGSTAVALALMELAARLLWQPQTWRPSSELDLAKSDLPTLNLYWQSNLPNASGIRSGVYFRTNSWRLRGPEYTREPPAGFFRIMIAGDSVTAGAGVDEADAYPQQLERMLNADKSKRWRFEVLNVGLGGLDIRQVMRRLEWTLRHYRAHLLIYGWTINDIEGPHYRDLRAEHPELNILDESRRFATSPSYLLRTIWPRWIDLREFVHPTPGSYVDTVFYNYFRNPAAWRDFTAGLERFVALARREGVCGHVLIHTHLTELGVLHPFREVYARVAEAARDRGLTVTQSFPFYRGRNAFSMWIGPSNPHPTAEGHEILARALQHGLRELPARCWKRQARRRPL